MTDNSKHWLIKFKANLCSHYSSLIFIIIVDILSITILSIGFTFQVQCTIQQNIAIYLIIGGFLFIIYYIFLVVIMILLIRAKSSGIANISTTNRRVLLLSMCFMCLFLMIWLIFGCVWTFQLKSTTVQSYNNNPSIFCQLALYDYTFIYCIFLLIICFAHYINFCSMARTI